MQDEVLIAGFGRRGHAVGDIPGVRFKVRRALCQLAFLLVLPLPVNAWLPFGLFLLTSWCMQQVQAVGCVYCALHC